MIIVEILVGKEGAIGRLDGQRSDDDRGLLAIGIGLLIILLLACCGASDRISLPVARNTGVVSGRLIRVCSLTAVGIAACDWMSLTGETALVEMMLPGLEGEIQKGAQTAGETTVTEIPPAVERTELVSEVVASAGMKTEESDGEPIMPAAGVKLILHGNGGIPERTEYTYGSGIFSMEELEALEEPKRLGKLFDGWSLDGASENPFTGEATEGTTLELYAGWKEFPGYLCDDAGYVIGYSDAGLVLTNGLAALPTHESCVGLKKGAFAGIEEGIFEVYIPANITEIQEGAFSSMTNLFFIEAASGNPKFYSESGILYHKDGTLAVMPPGRIF